MSRTIKVDDNISRNLLSIVSFPSNVLNKFKKLILDKNSLHCNIYKDTMEYQHYLQLYTILTHTDHHGLTYAGLI